ncbi:KpsF/GutQ family sugar-phosphate isomerase [Ketobacter sp. MCCC 1A13808]|uniref:KpsF/GutQ family sugar-phosphate isomerase n=1 Tax=Ketobacter sp. MCCC 1A13808 TaxID=2602738 RepID=UPI000F12800A|nr:KpsF/GutQ family sugar-phosphate isomerase [Ketobacter sp. MCCC 1A13808]MVF11243.1 KpsF/GutQ family sugar-phosphate isomerase [Ketobacter sp. MCCC 1A13808]RLP53626.1 MAG: KpsF/GutQ family sugar-phosphate isomerase [Ketobacter sp.]
MNTRQDGDEFIQSGRRVIEIETAATHALLARIDKNFQNACEILMQCKGRVIITGMGKSGHIGNKIAATLASTGTPSFFVHPGEASHGDLGMITGEDVVIAISNSGKTEEIVNIVPLIKRKGAPLISMAGDNQSPLATQADVHLDISVKEEACPLGLAPTASTTATLVMGDAIAVALLEARGFTADDFALSHPGGSLGRRLLLLVENIMHSGDKIPLVAKAVTISDALLEMSSKGLGMTGIVDHNNKLIGVFTDGDLRRMLDQGLNTKTTSIEKVMTANPKTISPHILAVEALNMMDKSKITALMVVDKSGTPIGALNMHDLLRAGVM